MAGDPEVRVPSRGAGGLPAARGQRAASCDFPAQPFALVSFLPQAFLALVTYACPHTGEGSSLQGGGPGCGPPALDRVWVRDRDRFLSQPGPGLWDAGSPEAHVDSLPGQLRQAGPPGVLRLYCSRAVPVTCSGTRLPKPAWPRRGRLLLGHVHARPAELPVCGVGPEAWGHHGVPPAMSRRPPLVVYGHLLILDQGATCGLNHWPGPLSVTP